LGNEAARLDSAHAQTLVRALGYLPLALHLAAGYLRASHSVGSFLALLKKKGLELEPVHRNDPLFTEDQARAIIRRTFELSLELLRRQLGSDEAGRWLAGLAALGHAPLSGFGQSLGAAIAGLTEQEFRELAAAATSLSLLGRVPLQGRKDDAWRVHPLLAELLRTLPGAEPGLKRMTQWFVERLPELPAGEEQKQGENWKEIQREGNALADWLLQVPEGERARVERAGSWFAIHQGPFPVWMEFCERALRGPLTSTERSHFLWTLGHAAKEAGALERALWAVRAKGTLDQERQAPREAALAAGLHADILEERGALDEALHIRREEELPVFQRLGDVRERAVVLAKMAKILRARGQLDEALRILRQEALPAFEQLGDVRSRAITLGRIADILELRGQLDEALQIRQQEELPVYERLGDVRERAVVLGKIADILELRGQLDEALRIRQEEELPVYERLGAVRERALTLGQVAGILEARGQLDEALRIRQEEELPVYERLGDVQSRAIALGRIADILQARGQLDEALRIRQEEELPVYERLGDVRLRAVTLGQIADILQARGQLDEALRIRQEEELPVYERLGDVRSQAATLFKIALIIRTRGRPEEALTILQQQALPVFERLGAARELKVTREWITYLLAKK
jgi:tetratricopeptide (TPR) repeat protein